MSTLEFTPSFTSKLYEKHFELLWMTEQDEFSFTTVHFKMVL